MQVRARVCDICWSQGAGRLAVARFKGIDGKWKDCCDQCLIMVVAANSEYELIESVEE